MTDRYHGKPCIKCGGTLRYSWNYRCVPCQAEASRVWHEANRVKHNAQMRLRYAENRRAEIARARKWNREHEERVAAGQRRRYNEDRDEHG